MGIMERLFPPEVSRPDTEPVSARSVQEAIAAAIAARADATSLEDVLRLPPVRRAVDLICGVAASMAPITYKSGVVSQYQPPIVSNPSPPDTREQFVWATVYAMVATTDATAYWHVADTFPDKTARTLRVLDPREVTVTWDAVQLHRVYTWRGKLLRAGIDLFPVGFLPPGILRRDGPIQAALRYLAIIAAAEEYAATFFGSGGIPETVLETAAKLTKDEAQAFKLQWIESRNGPEPAVLSGGIAAKFPGVDPQKAQMQESRAYGATVVARLLGIPHQLLHVETSGATITYVSSPEAINDLVKGTVLPSYLRPIEAAWSRIAPGQQTVRFELAELQRADITQRFANYRTAVDGGFMRPEEVREYEGWGPLPFQTEAGVAA